MTNNFFKIALNNIGLYIKDLFIRNIFLFSKDALIKSDWLNKVIDWQ